jgi:hypothetical protein
MPAFERRQKLPQRQHTQRMMGGEGVERRPQEQPQMQIKDFTRSSRI